MADAFVAIQPPLDVYRNRCEPTTRLDGLDEAGVVQVPVTEVEADDAVRRELGLAQRVPIDVGAELVDQDRVEPAALARPWERTRARASGPKPESGSRFQTQNTRPGSRQAR